MACDELNHYYLVLSVAEGLNERVLSAVSLGSGPGDELEAHLTQNTS